MRSEIFDCNEFLFTVVNLSAEEPNSPPLEGNSFYERSDLELDGEVNE